ncbi:MAG: hypothetical protein QM765_50865 [Myxococcales bacterium]
MRIAATSLLLSALLFAAPSLALAEEASLMPLSPASAPAEATQPPPAPKATPAVAAAAPDLPTLEPHASLQTLVLFRNDGDFDRTKPYYDPDGQEVGAAATILTPDILWRPTRSLRLFYQAELGLNFWGKQSVDAQGASPDVFVLRHKELYGEGEIGPAGFKLGFSEFQDATGLFVHHWIGVAQLRWFFAPEGQAEVFFGQVPDQTWEGVNVLENNFTRDIFVYGAKARYAFSEALELTVALHAVWDSHVVGQVRRVFCPNLELVGKKGIVSGSLDLALQAGRFSGTALGGGDQDLLAWAAQGRVEVEAGPVRLQLNALALSPDGDYDGGPTTGAFLYSGKSRSATLMLTEDEVRNWYDSFDLRMASFHDGFYANRAGLFVGDLKATLDVVDGFAPSLIVGAAATLNPNNSLGESFVGVETGLLLEYRFNQYLRFHGLIEGFFPGGAGAALVNAIDLSRTDPVFQGELSVALRY